MLLTEHRCRCRTCRKCGEIYGWKVRRRLLAKASEFKHPAMLTLTLKPDRFGNDPLKAFLHITDGKYIARLMKHLGVKRWVAVLEFQKSGWAHWHVLVDKPDGYLDLKKAWEWWGWNRDAWQFGGVDLGLQKFRDASHAIRYITKYLIKYPTHGFPAWVLDCPRRIRWVNSSRSVGRVVSDREMTVDDVQEAENAEEAAASLPVKHRTLRVRMKDCGESVVFWRESVDAEGVVRLEWCGRLSRGIVSEAVRRGFPVLADDDGDQWVPHVGDCRPLLEEMCRMAGHVRERHSEESSKCGLTCVYESVP